MIDPRPVFLVMGLFTAITGGLMLIPAYADFVVGTDNWHGFAISAMVVGATGISLAASAWGRIEQLSARQGFLITTMSWVAIVAAAALPMSLGSMSLSYTDAFFEAMSGLTTTGSTVVSGLDTAPPGFLLWRSILQWIGGVGVIIMAIAVLPFLSVGGMQLFRLESSDPTEKILPGASQIAAAIMWLYLGFTSLCFLTYWWMGMTPFDAINHAMTTIATGGFSTKDASFNYFIDDPSIRGPIDMVAALFMALGALPFGVFLLMVRGTLKAPLDDSQVRLFLAVAGLFIAVVTIRLLMILDADPFTAFRLATFNTISIMTGTGYASTDYGQWGPFAIGFFFCIMFVGGCAGSTSCGLKVFRLQVAFSALSLFVRRLSHPHRSTVARYNGRAISDDVFISVLSFFFLYFAVFAVVAVFLSLFGLDTVTALSAAGTAIANVGPGLGDVVGPSGNFSTLPDAVKWALSATMLLGRLELFTVLVLFTPGFWSR